MINSRGERGRPFFCSPLLAAGRACGGGGGGCCSSLRLSSLRLQQQLSRTVIGPMYDGMCALASAFVC
jgi:hypothetical protein